MHDEGLPSVLLTPRDQGRAAYLNGLPDSNPYPKTVPQHYRWNIGYLETWRDDPYADHGPMDVDDDDLRREIGLAEFETDIFRETRLAARAAGELMKLAPDLAMVVAASGLPLEAWAGNCHGVATAVLESGILKERWPNARVMRGHFLGEIAPEGYFGRRSRAVQQHSWIRLEERVVLDPTRFAFDGREPYVFIGSDEDYDLAGQHLRQLCRPDRPCPSAGKDEARTHLRLGNAATAHVLDLTGLDELRLAHNQLFWLANLPLVALAPHAREIHDALAAEKAKAFIPIDLWNETHLEAA